MDKKFSDLYLKIAYFFISRQVFFRRLFLGWFFFLNLILWVFVIIAFTNYFSGTYRHEQEMAELSKDVVNYQDYYESHKAVDIKKGQVSVIHDKTSGKYDFAVKVKNLNAEWVAVKIKYYFDYGRGVTDVKETYLLAGQSKYLFDFGVELNGDETFEVEQAKLIISDIDWKRMANNDHQEVLKDLASVEHDFIKEEGYSYIDFVVSNESPYDYWETNWQLVLYRADKIIGVSQVTDNVFLAGEEENLRATWFSVINTPQEVEIIPDVDLLNENIIIPKDIELDPKEIR